ncbi:Uncharacterised protein [Neisseria gonorrhoeae]|nr:Uncharacterised protein [Neisseria gonorrhoeae]
MFIFYTVNPEHVYFPKAYIMKVFKDKGYESQCITNSFFLYLQSDFEAKDRNEAYEYGRLFVKELDA